MGGGRKSSETEETPPRRGGSRASSVSDEGGFNEPSPEVVARLKPADYRDTAASLTADQRDDERARSDADTLSVLQQVHFVLVIVLFLENVLYFRTVTFRFVVY